MCAFICSTISNLNVLNVLLEDSLPFDHITQTRGVKYEEPQEPGGRKEGWGPYKAGPQPGSSD